MPVPGRFRPRRWRRATSCRRGISNRSIVRGVRGPHGGYELARAHRSISVEDILRAINTAEESARPAWPPSPLANAVVKPALVEAEHSFDSALGRISVEGMAVRASALK